eukprot:Platyproteum_vivax@DN3540_c0_g1_i1.p1
MVLFYGHKALSQPQLRWVLLAFAFLVAACKEILDVLPLSLLSLNHRLYEQEQFQILLHALNGVNGTKGIFGAFLPIIVGFIIDWQGLHFVCFCSVMIVLIGHILILSGSAWFVGGLIVAGQALYAIGSTVFLTAEFVLVGYWFRGRECALAFALVVLAQQFGTIGGNLLMWFATSAQVQPLFVVFIMLLTLGCMLTLISAQLYVELPSPEVYLKPSVYEDLVREEAHQRKFWKRLGHFRVNYWLLLVMFLSAYGSGFVVLMAQSVLAFMDHIRSDPSSFSPAGSSTQLALFIVPLCAQILTPPSLGFLFDKMGCWGWACMSGLLLQVVVMTILPFIQGELVASSILFGVLIIPVSILVVSLMYTCVSLLVEPQAYGIAFGLILAASCFGSLFLSWMGAASSPFGFALPGGPEGLPEIAAQSLRVNVGGPLHWWIVGVLAMGALICLTMNLVDLRSSIERGNRVLNSAFPLYAYVVAERFDLAAPPLLDKELLTSMEKAELLPLTLEAEHDAVLIKRSGSYVYKKSEETPLLKQRYSDTRLGGSLYQSHTSIDVSKIN